MHRIRSSERPAVFILRVVCRPKNQPCILCLPGQSLNLSPDFIVFCHLPFQETYGQTRLGLQTPGCQVVQILQLVFGSFETIDFNQPFFRQRSKAIVDLAQTDPHFPGHLPLGQVGISAEKFQQMVANFLLCKVVHGLNI